MEQGMPFGSAHWKWKAAVGVVAVSVGLTAWWIHLRAIDSIVPHRTYQLDAAQENEWQAVGGKWEMIDGIAYNNSHERGAKLLTGSRYWRNYTLRADLRFSGTNADMGVVLRTNDEREGTDTYNGYYVGVRTLDGTVVLGRSDFGWREARPVMIPGGVQSMVWYRLVVTAYGCDIAASVENLKTLQSAAIAIHESYCLASGRIGLRSLNAGGMWRNISVAPASRSDYLAVRRQAGSLEHLEFVPGPPWWNPWHAVMLFGSFFAVLLVLQLSYFRMRQWKTNTIMRERERFAHEIHDTMAQSFAGIGYQIQGIRHRLTSAEGAEVPEIAAQLNVAYQLVRKCHEEASRTIAMLGSRSPSFQENVLMSLAEIASQIAGNQIRIVPELRGNVRALKLRLADALLHIGREAIVNAISYADPTLLQLTLSYSGDQVELVVEDNGCGFDYRPEAAGFGILGMQKHARDVGAVLDIASSPESGTRVSVRAALQQERLRARIFAETKARLWKILGQTAAG
jgi:signal transduction histidine kinase